MHAVTQLRFYTGVEIQQESGVKTERESEFKNKVTTTQVIAEGKGNGLEARCHQS